MVTFEHLAFSLDMGTEMIDTKALDMRAGWMAIASQLAHNKFSV